jgi:hypothetical protein
MPFDFNSLRDQRGGIRVPALLLQLLRRPQKLGALVRLAQDCRLAGRQLADFLDGYVQVLDAGLHRPESAMAAAI